MLRILQIFLIGSCLVQAGCGEPFRKKKKKTNHNGATEYFVHGDPMLLVKDAKLKQKSFLTVDNFREFNGYELKSFSVFVEKEVKKKRPEVNIEKENATDTDDNNEPINSPLFRSHRFSQHGSSYTLTADDYGKPLDWRLSFNFAENDQDRLGLEEVEYDSKDVHDRIEVEEVLHYSQNAEAFSILFRSKDSSKIGRALWMFYFEKSAVQFSLLANVNEDYDYLLGGGVRAVWPGKIVASVCEKDPRDAAILKDSFNDWRDATGLVAGREFEIDVLNEFPPFSDVDYNCVQLAPVYRMENRDDAFTLGTTYVVIDPRSRQISHSSVFVWDGAFDKIATLSESFEGERREKIKRRTMRHEAGHYFGLGHEFDRDPNTGALLHPSIMSYDGVDDITAWDREALNALYKN